MALSGLAWTAIILVGLFFFSIIGVLIYAAYKLRKGRIPPNATFDLIFPSHRCSGYALGIQLDSKPGWGNKVLTTFKPLDLGYDGNGRVIPSDSDTKDAPAKQSKVIDLPVGTFSQRRNFRMILPEYASDLPENLLNTKLGKAIGLLIEAENASDLGLQMVKEGSITQKNVAMKLQSGELVEKYKKQLDDFLFSVVNKPVQDAVQSGKQQPPKEGNQ